MKTLICAVWIRGAVLPASCMVGRSISRVSANSCLCRASRWTQLRQCSRVSGRRLGTEHTCHSHSFCSLVHVCAREAEATSPIRLLMVDESHLSCVLVRLLVDLNLTISLGCRLARSICWKTPAAGAERRGTRKGFTTLTSCLFS